MNDQGSCRRVVIIGGGFAGLFAARALRSASSFGRSTAWTDITTLS
jgi:cation diffusion facilitator CzcD-associated flavoprotein CzcO